MNLGRGVFFFIYYFIFIFIFIFIIIFIFIFIFFYILFNVYIQPLGYDRPFIYYCMYVCRRKEEFRELVTIFFYCEIGVYTLQGKELINRGKGSKGEEKTPPSIFSVSQLD